MTSAVLVTGGTGTLGRSVLPLLQERGLDVRVLTRDGQASARGRRLVVGDLATGEGVAAAVAGVDTILHLAGSAKGDDVKARNLVAAAAAAGRPHLVFISVVGADRIPVVSRADRAMFGYFAAKREAERIVAGSGLPWSTLRATQFHDLTFQTVQGMAKMPVVPVPSGFRFQPVDAGEVATRLVGLALGDPSGLVPDIGGPHVYEMRELVRSYLDASGRRRLTMPVRVAGQAARAFRKGANLSPTRAVGKRTWDEFLADRLGADPERRADPIAA